MSLKRSLTGCRTKIKTRLETAYGELVERIPAWIKWATQVSLDDSRSHQYVRDLGQPLMS